MSGFPDEGRIERERHTMRTMLQLQQVREVWNYHYEMPSGLEVGAFNAYHDKLVRRLNDALAAVAGDP